MQQKPSVALRNFSFGLGAQLLIKLFSFAFNVFVVRTLGDEAFGRYSAINAYGQIFLFLADLGLSTYAVRLVAQTRDKAGGMAQVSKLLANLVALRLVLSLASAGMAIGSAWLTGRPGIFLAAMALNAISLLMYAIQSSSGVVLSGLERMDKTSKAQVLFQFCFVVFGTIALVSNAGYIGLIIANIGAVLILTTVTVRAVQAEGMSLRGADARDWLPLLRSAAPFAVLSLALGLSYKFDSVLIENFQGSKATGYYNAAYNLVFNCVLFSNVLNTTLYPTLTRQSASDPAGLGKSYERALRYLLIVALPLTVGIYMLSDDLIPFLFKEQFLPAADALKILIWVVPLQYVSEFLGYVILIAQREKIVARSVVISSLINVAANLMVIPRYGFMGAAVMTLVTEIVLVGQYVFLLRDQLRILDWRRFFVRPMACAAVLAMVLALTISWPWQARAVAGGLAYVVALVALKTVGREEIDFIRRLRPRAA